MYKLFFQIILLQSLVFSHQFFLTTTEVRLSDNQKSLEITIQTFTHDVEALLKKADFNLANLGSERENKNIDDFIILAVCCDKATRKLIIDGESVPNIDVD